MASIDGSLFFPASQYVLICPLPFKVTQHYVNAYFVNNYNRYMYFLTFSKITSFMFCLENVEVMSLNL